MGVFVMEARPVSARAKLILHMAWRLTWVWGSIVAAACVWGWQGLAVGWTAAWALSVFVDRVVLETPLAKRMGELRGDQ
jgi:hypothetical protein